MFEIFRDMPRHFVIYADTALSATATIRLIIVIKQRLSFDMRMRFIANKFEVFEFKVENILHMRVKMHFRSGIEIHASAVFRLLNVIGVKVRITKSMHKITGLETAHLRHHKGEQ